MAVMEPVKIGNKTKEEWETTLQCMRRVISTLTEARDKAKKERKLTELRWIQQDLDALVDVYALVKYLIQNYSWWNKDTEEQMLQ